ncbi:tRNA (adenosine(37)-N6)-threonylcarbamoyltransferase complex ATPase subunit type 1 TsaE [Serpentinicella sp. ANB-PHB4]|uniref:tRNA (adenosine(37)-N6)-threonylcarbamoyltransferase complex ATPase subunit type 1 TsaE n=1 Tax=Serpentinicella sp. ANB-PHB4 TaxID=3074076 RepID=UPI0028571FD6|nr:tRNA (adenosine(37)-N6)-threonylcarbamoyltransferase complex ATPase subunit type 1 TsaE [Serpentinicella sp. ANB-PHB4]MDR5659808.1 tRNA (adenosine(37)-N6)-threonylcarbamoyltransferase complex ATPase subunit type 1 TsaE [Serpentinicella sp. ANB-PHB4]
MRCVNINELKETEKIAKKLGQLLSAGDILCLQGDLGAGKTTFTQSLAKGLEVEDHVTSPTFTIVQEYEGRLPLYHFDVYRIGDPLEMESIGYEEYFFGQGVCVIEWAYLIEEILPEDRLWIEMKYVDENKREICFKYTNDYYRQIVEELLKG